ncbi:MAG: site-specific DNA-methyltransferase [Candidatus Thorarchaeota archaeon]
MPANKGKTQKHLNRLNGKDWVKATKSWFVVNPKPRKKAQKNHPAKFPEELVSRFVQFFTQPGAWVIDPFAGVGSTCVACSQLVRNSVGIELMYEFVEIGLMTLKDVPPDTEYHLIVGDSAKIDSVLAERFGDDIPMFDFLITSPPYWNMLRKSRGGNETVHKERGAKGLKQYYSDSNLDLGNINSYENYIESVGRVLDGVHPFLSDGAYLAVIVQNMRDVDGIMRPIAWDLARRLSRMYELKQEQIWCQDNKRLGCWGFPTTYVSNVHHHYCLVLQKAKGKPST